MNHSFSRLASVTRSSIFLLGAVALLSAVNTQAQEKKKELPRSTKLEPYQCGSVERLHTLDGIFLASQPNQDDFKTAREGGIRTVINLREKEELEWDEEALAKDLGFEYHHIPFKSPASLTDEVFDKTRRLLKDTKKKPILLHCSSANRVGAIWLAHRVLDHKISHDQALEEAKTVGLKLPAYVERAKDYIERTREAEPVKTKSKK